MLVLAVPLQDEDIAAPELSYITYHAGLTHFLFAHIIAEVLDVLALVTIALGFSKRVGVAGGPPFVSGAAQHR